MSAPQLNEKDLILPAVRVLYTAHDKKMTTAEMVTGLAAAFGVESVTARFDRAVRNLKSHRTLAKAGLAKVTGSGSTHYQLTKAGREVAVALANVTPAAAVALATQA